jgi:hypothetical protein
MSRQSRQSARSCQGKEFLILKTMDTWSDPRFSSSEEEEEKNPYNRLGATKWSCGQLFRKEGGENLICVAEVRIKIIQGFASPRTASGTGAPSPGPRGF